MRVRTASVSTAVAAAVLAGCGASTTDQVRSKVQEFAVAVAHKDASRICDDVFAPSLVEHFKAAGLTCVRGMGIFFSGLHHPTLAVGPITVRGSKASVITLSGANGQTAAVRSINLVDTSNGWRIISLGGSPVAGKSTTSTSPRTTSTSSRSTSTSGRTTSTSSKRSGKP
jgi:hypothetical protein